MKMNEKHNNLVVESYAIFISEKEDSNTPKQKALHINQLVCIIGIENLNINR